MSDWEYDSTQKGLRTLFFDYEIEELNYLWSRNGEYASSREVYDHVVKLMPISRASIINSLNKMARAGILKYDEKTGKGGHKGLYTPAFSEAEMRKHLARELLESIRENLS